MKTYLTPTLLNSWLYYLNSSEDNENAKESFLNTLNKIKTEPTPDMLRGLSFEDEIYKFLEGKQPLEKRADKLEIADTIKGSLLQEPVMSYFTEYKDLDVYIYGVTDAMRANIIFDIKSVRSYTPFKYLGSTQHLIYLCATNCDTFQYLISDGESMYVETYHKSDKVYSKLRGIINNFLNWLEITGNMETYKKNYLADEKLEAFEEL